MRNTKTIKELLQESASELIAEQRKETYAKFTKEELRRADESEKDSDPDSFIDSEEYFLVKDMLVNHYFSTMDRVAEPRAENSNVVSFPNTQAAAAIEESVKVVPLFDVVPAAAQPKDSQYKWYHLEGDFTDSLGNVFSFLMEPVGNDKVTFRLKVLKKGTDWKENNRLGLFSDKWTEMDIKFGDSIVIRAEFHVDEKQVEIVGDGVVLQKDLPKNNGKRLEFIPAVKDEE